MGSNQSFLYYIVITIANLLSIYNFLIIAKIVIYWIGIDKNRNNFTKILHQITNPALNFARKHFYIHYKFIDFSPLILIFLINFIKIFIVGAYGILSSGGTLFQVFLLIIYILLIEINGILFFLLILLIARFFIIIKNPSYPSLYYLIAKNLISITNFLIIPFKFTNNSFVNETLKTVVTIILILLFKILITNITDYILNTKIII